MSRIRQRLEHWLNAVWYAEDTRPPWWLRVLSSVYARGFTRRKNAQLPLRPGAFTVPVIVVGNITAGGTGKTPVVLALVSALKSRGYTPAVISRGYGRKNADVFAVEQDSDVRDSGDEPLLIHQKTGVPVFVAGDRNMAAKSLLQKHPHISHIIADDGLQHFALKRDIEIVVIDHNRAFGNGHLIPAGPLREPIARIKDADFLVASGPVAGLECYQLTVRNLLPLNAVSGKSQNWDQFPNVVHVLLGVGNPNKIINQIQHFKPDCSAHIFADHHAYSKRELAQIPGPLLTTEKDYLRFPKIDRDDIWILPISITLPDALIDAILQRSEKRQQQEKR